MEVQIVGGPSAAITGGTVVANDGSGNTGTLGSPNGAGLTLTGAGGTSITEDGTVPSTEWNDGVGNTLIVGPNFIDPDTVFIRGMASDGSEFQLNCGADGAAISVGGTNAEGTSISLNVTGSTASYNLTDPINGLFASSGAAQAVSTGQFGIGSLHQTTVGGAGGASPLPVTPLGYWLANVGGTAIAIPYYAAS